MEKIIKRTISLTTKKRDSRNKLFEEFYSHDKNTATFEFTVDGGVPTEEIVVLFHFKRTNRHLEVRGRVDNDKIIVNFDTSLIVKDEQVAGYIYYENGEKSNDVYRFMFDVHVSEIDKERDLPIMEQESKRIVPLTDIVTKSEITELLKKIVANEKLYDDTEIKQQIDLKADKETVQTLSSKVEALENNSGNRPTYDDAEIRGQIATKADTQAVEAIAQRVQTLENKPDNDTVYNDAELRQAIEAKADKQALLQYLPKSELTPINDKVQSIETNIGRMATQQQLESYVSKEELENKGYLTSADTHNFALKGEIPVATNLDSINEKIRALEEKPQVDLSHLATKKEIEDSHYLTREDITGLATNSKVEAVESRVQQLENKPPVDLSNLATKQELDTVRSSQLTVDNPHFATKQELEAVRNSQPTVDTSNLVTKQELEDKHYLTSVPEVDTSHYVTREELDSKHYIQDVSNLATNAKVDEVEARVQTIENKPAVDLSLFVTKQELEAKQYLKDHQPLDGYVKKSELPPQVDTSTLVSKQELTSMNLVNAEALGEVSKKILEQTTKITALEAKSAYEIHGTGMPNGRVSAPIGTTYVDTEVTNGALKWIKESGDGNTGWKVFTGDTGWRNLNIVSKLGNSFLKIRRVNNQVTYQFGGLQWGWFGIIRRGGAGYFSQPTDIERNCYILTHNQIPEGFRTPNSLIGAIYNDRGTPYGTWYVGNPADANHLRFQFSNPVPTDSDIGDIRVSSISYYTGDEWPTVLP